MANDDELDLSLGDDELEDFDLDFGLEDKSDEPVTMENIGKRTIEAATKVDYKRVENFARSMMPKEVNRDVEKLEGIVKVGIDTFNQKAESLKKATDETVKGIKEIAPGLGSLIDKFYTVEDEYKRQRESEEERLDRLVSSELMESFGDLAKVQELQNQVNQTLEDKRTKSTNEILKAMQADTAFIKGYERDFTSKFQSKLLQVQIKSLYTLVDIKREQHDIGQLMIDRLGAITENTSLPDVLKARKFSSMLFSEFKAQARKSLTDTFYNNDAMKRMRAKVKNGIESVFDMPISFMENIGSGLDQAIQAKEMMGSMGVSKNEIIADQLVAAGDQELGKRIGKKLGQNKLVASFYNMVHDFVTDPKAMIGGIQEKLGDDNIASRAANSVLDTVADVLDTKDSTKTIDVSRKDLNTPDTIDIRTKLSINKAIPGFLSKIHSEVRATRLGVEDPDISKYELVFDYRTETFKSRSAKFGAIKAGFFKDAAEYQDSTHRTLNYNLYKKMGLTQEDMSEKDRKKLSTYLASQARNYNLNVAALSKAEIEDLSKETGVSEEALNNFMTKFNEYTSDVKNRSELNTQFKRITARSPGFHRRIEDALENGNQDALIEAGVLEMNRDGELSVNTKFLNDYLFRTNIGKKRFKEGDKRIVSLEDPQSSLTKGYSNIISEKGLKSDMHDLYFKAKDAYYDNDVEGKAKDLYLTSKDKVKNNYDAIRTKYEEIRDPELRQILLEDAKEATKEKGKSWWGKVKGKFTSWLQTDTGKTAESIYNKASDLTQKGIDKATPHVQNAIDKVKSNEKVQEAVKKVSENEYVKKATDLGKDLYNEIPKDKESISKLVQDVKENEKVKKVTDKVTDKVNTTKDKILNNEKVKQAMGYVEENMPKDMNDLKDKVTKATDNIKDKISNVSMEDIKSKVGNALDLRSQKDRDLDNAIDAFVDKLNEHYYATKGNVLGVKGDQVGEDSAGNQMWEIENKKQDIKSTLKPVEFDTLDAREEKIAKTSEDILAESKIVEAINSARESGNEEMINVILDRVSKTSLRASSAIKKAATSAKQSLMSSKLLGNAAMKAAEKDEDKWNGMLNMFRLSKVGYGITPLRVSTKFALSTLGTIIRKGHGLDWKIAKGLTMGALKGGLGLGKGLGKGLMSGGAGVFGIGKGLTKGVANLATGGKYGKGWKRDLFDGAVDIGGLAYHPLMETAAGMKDGFKQGWNSKLRSPFQFAAHQYKKYKKLWGMGGDEATSDPEQTEGIAKGKPKTLDELGFENPDMKKTDKYLPEKAQHALEQGKSVARTAKSTIGKVFSKGKEKINNILGMKDDTERKRANELSAMNTMASEAMILNADPEVQDEIMKNEGLPSTAGSKSSRLYRRMKAWMKKRKKGGKGLLGGLLGGLGGKAMAAIGGLFAMIFSKGLSGILWKGFKGMFSFLLKNTWKLVSKGITGILGGISSLFKSAGGALVKGIASAGKGLVGGAAGLVSTGAGAAMAGAKAVGSKVASGAKAVGKAMGLSPSDKLADASKKIDKAQMSKAAGNGSGKKGLMQKMKDALKGLKDKVSKVITKKLGPKGAAKVTAKLAGKVASRLVPFVGWGLLAFDVAMMTYYLAKGHTFLGALTKTLIGFDPWKDDADEVPVDENGNPIKPDDEVVEKLEEKESKGENAESANTKEDSKKEGDKQPQDGTVSDEIKKKEKEEAQAQAAKTRAESVSTTKDAFLEIIKANRQLGEEQLAVMVDTKNEIVKVNNGISQIVTLLGEQVGRMDEKMSYKQSLEANERRSNQGLPPLQPPKQTFNNSNRQKAGHFYAKR